MMHPMLNIAIQGARSASRTILRYFDQLDKVEVSEKEKNDYVTQVDKLSEEIIITEIQKAYPRHAIIAEENGKLNSSNDEYCWIIDPLDGTRNFMHGFPQFSISIALMKKNVLELGMVYDPIRQELFTATRGQGAYLNSRRLRVSPAKKFSSTLIGTGFPFCDKDDTERYLKKFQTVFTHCGDIRRAGSAALDLAYVAAGRLDGYWEAGLEIWDIAAGVLMIKEAGGIVTDFQGAENYLDSGDVIAGNLKSQKELFTLLTLKAN